MYIISIIKRGEHSWRLLIHQKKNVLEVLLRASKIRHTCTKVPANPYPVTRTLLSLWTRSRRIIELWIQYTRAQIYLLHIPIFDMPKITNMTRRLSKLSHIRRRSLAFICDCPDWSDRHGCDPSVYFDYSHLIGNHYYCLELRESATDCPLVGRKS